jgi:hypothetical protein
MDSMLLPHSVLAQLIVQFLNSGSIHHSDWVYQLKDLS